MLETIQGLDGLIRQETGYRLKKDILLLKDGNPISDSHNLEKKVNTRGNVKDVFLKHVWEIHNFLKCPLSGTCLTIQEQSRILKKARHSTKGLKPYQIHAALMEHLHSKNPVSLKLDNYLRHKYRRDIPLLVDHNEEQFMKSWWQFFLTDRMDALFFVAVTRKDLSLESLQEIFGELHMLGHTNLKEAVKNRQSILLKEEANERLVNRLNQTREHSRKLQKEATHLKASLRDSQKLLKDMKKGQLIYQDKNDRRKAFESEKMEFKARVRSLQNHCEQQSENIRVLEREKRQLQIELFDFQSTNGHLADEINGLITQISSFVECRDSCREDCPRLKLCAKRVLIVGGITRMKHLYRGLVESSGGNFEYHDGYMQNGQQHLENRVRRCDMVICPVNCNSHTACIKVKKMCQKHKKPVKMLPSSSLSAISIALFEESKRAN